MKNIALIGYSGHAYVVIDIFQSNGQKVTAYCEQKKQQSNPFNLYYLGKERESLEQLKTYDWFIAIGDNNIRQKVYLNLVGAGLQAPVSAIHRSAYFSIHATVKEGVMIGPNTTINSFARIETGVICNTGAIIEHECQIGEFAHIAPGAVLAGNVQIGERSFVGANSVVKQGVKIGKNVTIGAGSIIIRDIPDNVTVVGNPGKIIKTHD